MFVIVLFFDSDGAFLILHFIRRLMFPSKISPSLNIPDLHPKVTYCFSEGSAVSYHTAIYHLWLTDVHLKWILDIVDCLLCSSWLCRSSMVWHCLAWRTLSKSRRDFYVSPVGKPSSAVSNQGKTRKLMGQVNIHTAVFSYCRYSSFIHNISTEVLHSSQPLRSTCSNTASPLRCSKTPL